MTPARPGPLEELRGTWVGEGLSVLAEPGPRAGPPVLWRATATHEAIMFATVGPLVSGRGPTRPGAGMFGVQYLHDARDATSGRGVFIEPGVWLEVPGNVQSGALSSVVRFAALRTGHAVLADGDWENLDGPPSIGSVSSMPVDLRSRRPIAAHEQLESQAGEMPPGVPAQALADPNALLQRHIEGQRITSTTVLSVESGPDIERRLPHLPFVAVHPKTLGLQATLWIETIADPAKPRREVRQLQYGQRIVVNVDGVGWPQISVATLRRASPKR